MSFKSFLKSCLLDYFIITTCVTAAMAILGLAIDPTARFGYESFFSPLIFGFISIVPSFITYSHKELPFKETLIRKILHLIVLEAILIGFGFWVGVLLSAAEAFFFGITVFIVYILVAFISWKFDIKEANEINETLKLFQGRD